jgi:hypothetical protein
MCLSRSLPFLLPLSVCLSLSLDLSLCVCPSLTLSLCLGSSHFTGRNHSCCIEDWEDENGNEKTNSVYSWGFGGYGRLGHSSASDEHLPREIMQFAPTQGRPQFPQKQVLSHRSLSLWSDLSRSATSTAGRPTLSSSPSQAMSTSTVSFPTVQGKRRAPIPVPKRNCTIGTRIVSPEVRVGF